MIMNMWTKEIARLAHVSIEEAQEIQQHIECTDFSFSNSSESQLINEIEFAQDDIAHIAAAVNEIEFA